MKCAGHKALLPLLGALALKLVILEDPVALAAIRDRLEPADRDRQRWNNRNHEIARARQMGEIQGDESEHDDRSADLPEGRRQLNKVSGLVLAETRAAAKSIAVAE
jgi:hypothetical protein